MMNMSKKLLWFFFFVFIFISFHHKNDAIIPHQNPYLPIYAAVSFLFCCKWNMKFSASYELCILCVFNKQICTNSAIIYAYVLMLTTKIAIFIRIAFIFGHYEAKLLKVFSVWYEKTRLQWIRLFLGFVWSGFSSLSLQLKQNYFTISMLI